MISTARSCRARPAARAAGVALAAVLAVVASLPSQAKQSDRSEPVHVDAKAADAQASANGIVHLKGDVVINQGTLKVTADNGTIHLDGRSKPKRVVLTGHAHIKQLDDENQWMTGDADSIDYDITQGIAVLTGHAHIDQAGRGSISGGRLVYNTSTSAMNAQSQGEHRVHMVFLPQHKATSKSPKATTSTPSSNQGQP